MSFRFRVYLADGEELDDDVAAVPNWQPGDTLYIDRRAKYRVTKVDSDEDLEGSDYAGTWEVEPVKTTARTEG